MSDPAIYRDRWMALKDLLDSLEDTYANRHNFVERQVILRLVSSLRDFAGGQFDLFYYGFGAGPLAAAQPAINEPVPAQPAVNEPVPAQLAVDQPVPAQPAAEPPAVQPPVERYQLQSWDEFPPEDIWTGILEQVQNDIELIQHVASLRITLDNLALDTLHCADKLARLALQPAIDYGLVSRNAVLLTYFRKAPNSYILPYTDVGLIGIPYTCAVTARDYLAIPHEVGHYVYRNLTDTARQKLQEVKDALDIDPIYQDWIKAVFEELCADVYGCLVAGPVLALSFQELLLAHSQRDFRDGDGQHPNGAIRPLMHCLVLSNPSAARFVQGDWSLAAIDLEYIWQQELIRRHVSKLTLISKPPDGQKWETRAQRLNIATAIRNVTDPNLDHGPLGQIVDRIVNDLLNAMKAYIAPTPLGKGLGWAGEINSRMSPEELFGAYQRFIDAQCEDCRFDWAAVDLGPQRRWRQWAEQQLGRTLTPNMVIQGGEITDLDEIKPGSWGHLLHANGWMTNGPGPDSMHPAD